MTVKKKVPVKDLNKSNIYELIEGKLRGDPDNAYTIAGLMIEVFGVKESQIENRPFRDWPKGLPTLYSQINRCLANLKSKGFIKSVKHGKAWVYWWSVKDTIPAMKLRWSKK